MTEGLINKRVRIVFDDEGVKTRVGVLTSISDNWVCFISDMTRQEECMNRDIVRKVDVIQPDARKKAEDVI